MQAWESEIIRVSTGRLNTVNDTVIGGESQFGGSSTVSRYAGQLGKVVTYTAETIGPMFSSTVGTLYGGAYRYVKVRSTDDDSPALSVGSIVFWDTTLTNWQTAYQVTRDENLSSVDNAVAIAGIYIGGPEPGNYGFICIAGLCRVRFRAVLTASGAIGSRVYAAGTGDTGSDQGAADVLTTDSTSLANARFLGFAAATAPASNTVSPVLLQFGKNFVF